MDGAEINKRAEELITNFRKLSPEGREYFRQDPIGWITSRARLLRSADRSGDLSQVDLIIDEVTGLLGNEQDANRWAEIILRPTAEFIIETAEK